MSGEVPSVGGRTVDLDARAGFVGAGEREHTAPGKARLGGIEAVRGIASSAVIFYHVARHLDKAVGAGSLARATLFGHSGVDLFFVLSGFIILHVHYGDIDRRTRLGRYAARRITRVMPVYWVALALTVLKDGGGGHGYPSLLQLLRSATLAPAFEQPLLGVAWTLQCEVVFYTLFSTLILSRKLGAAVLGAWLALIVAGALAGSEAWRAGGFGFAPACIGGAYGLEFFLGMLAAWGVRRIAPFPAQTVLAAGLLLFSGAAVAEDLRLFDGFDSMSRLIYGVPSMMIVAGLTAVERTGRLSVPRPLRALGKASYSIYLFQFLLIGAAWKLWLAGGLNTTSPWLVCYMALAASAIAGGVAAQRLIEQPMLGWLRGERPITSLRAPGP